MTLRLRTIGSADETDHTGCRTTTTILGAS